MQFGVKKRPHSAVDTSFFYSAMVRLMKKILYTTAMVVKVGIYTYMNHIMFDLG